MCGAFAQSRSSSGRGTAKWSVEYATFSNPLFLCRSESLHRVQVVMRVAEVMASVCVMVGGQVEISMRRAIASSVAVMMMIGRCASGTASSTLRLLAGGSSVTTVPPAGMALPGETRTCQTVPGCVEVTGGRRRVARHSRTLGTRTSPVARSTETIPRRRSSTSITPSVTAIDVNECPLPTALTLRPRSREALQSSHRAA